MKWIEVNVRVDSEAAEAVCELFNRVNRGGEGGNAVIESSGYDARGELVDPTIVVKTYVPVDRQSEEVRRQIEEGLWHLGQLYPIPTPAFRVLTQDDWANAWKEHFPPLRVGGHLVIKPSWRAWDAAPGDIVIELDPAWRLAPACTPPLVCA